MDVFKQLNRSVLSLQRVHPFVSDAAVPQLPSAYNFTKLRADC